MRAVLIAGPTASGKSGVAVAVARALGGVVVNADSQQVYDGWRVLSARPSPAEMGGVDHLLYGHVAMRAAYSAGHWLRDVAAVLGAERRVPVIVGGTGLYFRALTEGLAEIPAVPAEVRADGEARLERMGAGAFAEAFAARDPETAAETDLANPRRVLRAWEVLEATGRGLAAWRAETPAPLLPLGQVRAVALVPERASLYARCEARFDQMMAAGALEEVRAVTALGLPAGAPGLGALGAAELMAHLRGEMGLTEAVAQAKMETRRYAKRQLTWVRNQMDAWETAPNAAAAVELLTA